MPVRTFWFLLLIVWLASACSRANAGPEGAERGASDRSATKPGEATVTIARASLPYLEVKAVSADAESPVVRAPGHVVFRDGAVSEVAAPVAGRVTAIAVKVGDRVKAHDPLVTLQSPEAASARAALDAALVAKKAAQAALARQSAMLEKGVGIESDEFQAETELAKTEAELARAERAVAYLDAGSGSTVVVRAPIDGSVLARKTTLGAAAEPGGEALIEIGDPAALWVQLDVFERDLPAIKPGAEARVEIPTATEPLRGRVAAVGNVLSSGMRTAPVYVTLEEPAQLRAGMYTRAAILSAAQQGVTLPTTAVLIKDGKKSIVYVAKGELTFLPREVVVGQPLEGRVQVLAGLSPGERVVQKGALLLDQSADQLL